MSEFPSMAAASSPPSSPTAGLLVVISGPSGVGKTSIVRAVREQLKGIFSISATTRPRTAQDVDGEDYHFVDETSFRRMVEDDAFIEHAQVFGRHWYGTPKTPVEKTLAAGQLLLLDIDVQGALQVRRSCPGAYLMFIDPPSEAELLRRLRDRARDNEEAIARRSAEAQREIELAHTSGAYDAFVVNDDLERAIKETTRLITQRRENGGHDAGASCRE